MAEQDHDTRARAAPAARLPGRRRRSSRALLARYGFAAFATALAFSLTRLLHPHVEQTLFLFFYTAVAASAWYGGLGPGLVATVLAVVAVDYAFIAPLGVLAPVAPGEVLALGVFSVLSVAVSSFSASFRAAKRRSDDASAEARALADQLEAQAVELELQVDESRVLAAELRQSNESLVASTAAADEARRVAERAERRASSTLESIADGFIACDEAWRFRYINHAAGQIVRSTGRDPGALLGPVVWDEFPELLGTAFEAETRRAAAERVTTEYEECYEPLDRWLHVRVYPADEGVTIYFRDVTEQKRAHAALRRQASLLEQTHDAILVWEPGEPERPGGITHWNRGAEALYGFTRDEALGRVSHELLGTCPTSPGGGVATTLDREAALARDGRWEGELTHATRDGRRIVVESRQVLVADAGARAYVVETNRDFTERKETEETHRIQLEAARVLAGPIDLEATLQALTALLVPRFADYTLVYLRDAEGELRQAAAAHADARQAHLLDEMGRIYRPEVTPESVTAQVLATATPVLQPVASPEEARARLRDPALLAIHRQLGPVSYMVVPLIARGQLLGTVALATSVSGRRYGPRDLALVEILAARAALALDNARLYTETLAARDQLIRASQLETQLMQARLDTLRAQLNPHFLFNTLNTVAMLVRRGATHDALGAVVALSELLRQLLDERGAAEVRLGQEIAVVEHYLALERLRFRDRLAVGVSIEPAAREARVPAMLLQPLVENAVKHGVARRDAPVRVEISGRRKRIPWPGGRGEGRMQDVLTLEVRDDGPGFAEGWDMESATGVGLANTRERLRRLYGDGHRFEARNAPGGGAVVTIHLPFRVDPEPGHRKRGPLTPA